MRQIVLLVSLLASVLGALAEDVWEKVRTADRAADAAWDACCDLEAYNARRAELKKRMIVAIGSFPARTPLNAKIWDRIPRSGYSIEKITFESRPGLYVTALLYLPDPAKFAPPHPAILLPCGHSGCGKGSLGYQRGCVMGAKEGFAVLIYDPLDQGERLQDLPGGGNVFGHNTLGLNAALVGGSMARFRIWDGIRALDYLCSRPDIDANRLGCMGNSGGGTMTSELMALDDRIKAAAPSCYLSSIRAVVDAIGPQDAEQNVFGQLAFGLNHAALVLMSSAAVRMQFSGEDMFPIDGSRETAAVVRRTADRLGIGERFDWTVVAGPHGWKESSRRSSLDWMRRWLMGETITRTESDYRKLDIGFDLAKVDHGLEEPQFEVTPTGSVNDLPGARTAMDIVREEFAAARRQPLPAVPVPTACTDAVTLEFKETGKVVHSFYGSPDPAEEPGALWYLLGSSLVEERAKVIVAAARAEKARSGKPPRIVAYGSWCPAVAFAYRSAPELFSGIRCKDAPRPWTETLVGGGRGAFATLVNGGALSGDWTSSLPDDTAKLQAQVDALAAKGGGVLAPEPGLYVVGGLELKSGVTLNLGKDVILLAADAPDKFARKMAFGRRSMVFAENAKDVSIVGEGVIDGNGAAYDRVSGKTPEGWPVLREGWHALCFDGCKGVKIEGVTVRGASFWTVFFRQCDGVVARGLRIRAHTSPNNDGIDISSRNVLVEDCDIDSEDDAIVFKAADCETVVENVRVRRCRLSTNSTFIKTGTETYGTIRDVTVEDCELAVNTPIRVRENHLDEPGVTGLRNAISGIEFNVVDGGSLERMTVRDIRMGNGIITPLSLRLARRNVRPDGRASFLRDVTVEGVRMMCPSAGRVACSLTGLPDLKPENVIIRDCDFIFPGGGTVEEASVRIEDERERSYPSAWYAFGSAFPAYGFYIRHAQVRLENNRIRRVSPDARPQTVWVKRCSGE